MMTEPKPRQNACTQLLTLLALVALALGATIASAGHAVAPAPARPDIVLADFEGRDYADWTAAGEAFGSGPAQGTLPNQMPVSDYLGHGLVNSFRGGDATTGTLTSPEFRIERSYLNFLLGGGRHPGETGMRLFAGGREALSCTGIDSEHLEWTTWDLRPYRGKLARIVIFDSATGGWGHINVDEITESDSRQVAEQHTGPLYEEAYRPQFHFTSATNWLNDPNGLVCYEGEYHLFFQHNPFGINWGNMTWGHAVSRDLVHWKQLADALVPDRLGTMFSGSAVVDRQNTSGFQDGKRPPLVAIYTAAGGTSPESNGRPFTQCIAYSNDRGRTWTKYPGNPALAHIVGENRDPKVVWHAASKQWIMALFLDKEQYGLFASPNLRDWRQIQTLSMPGSSECPDFFEMPIEAAGGPEASTERRWVFTGANGHYLIGTFDGTRFTPEAGPFTADYGANYYAVQTYSDIPDEKRRIQIAWMNGGSYPAMPFNQQMSFPCELTLRRTPAGLRIARWPVHEIESLHGEAKSRHDTPIRPGENLLAGLNGDLWDVEAEIELGSATAVGFTVRGESVRYSVADGTVTCLGRAGRLPAENGRIRLRLLVDRASIELFGNGGALSMTSCFVPPRDNRSLGLFAEGGTARLASLRVTPLKSAWPRH
jgi:fructan beta-fructosidase